MKVLGIDPGTAATGFGVVETGVRGQLRLVECGVIRPTPGTPLAPRLGEIYAGLTELLIPTNAALMAILLAAGIPYSRWIAFAFRGWLLLTALGIAGTLIVAATSA